ncbi:c-type cytochrome [Noviherbaspirillum pedocola]|uniref:Cytochrome c4 n=1 Tax=Noviherbaspirillum pedocola TaxID=2801341 RepID=A0A934SYL8_9BURK|nr:c-type cytochrome [Noviherbaspirillum pedocola]MBK4737705.1 cytochrome c4 [Noviherbaspirillum pedocola]
MKRKALCIAMLWAGVASIPSMALAQNAPQGGQRDLPSGQAAQQQQGQAAATPMGAAPGGGIVGNANAGQQIAASGAANGVTACVSCHGANGEGNAAGGFPRLAGQSEYYLSKQMAAFASGSRNNPIMSPIAKAMNEQQMRDVSAWYASVETPSSGDGGTSASAGGATNKGGGMSGKVGSGDRGQTLASVGDESKRVQACANCHGPNGAGEPPPYPYLAGQHASYLKAAMAEWKSGARNTDGSGQMPSIAKALSDADVEALANFYAAQPAPPPAGKTLNIAAGTKARPAVEAKAGASGPKNAAQGSAPQGVGTEQGAPTTGGAQGIGGGGAASGGGPQGSQSGNASQGSK